MTDDCMDQTNIFSTPELEMSHPETLKSYCGVYCDQHVSSCVHVLHSEGLYKISPLPVVHTQSSTLIQKSIVNGLYQPLSPSH